MMNGKVEIKIYGTTATGKSLGGFNLRSRPEAFVKHKITGMMNWYRQRVKEVIVDDFWPWKAQQMIAVIGSRRGTGPRGSSGSLGYPRWAAHREKYTKWKKKHYSSVAFDFWEMSGRFLGWLMDVAEGTVVGTSNWNKLESPSHLPYVAHVDQGFSARDGSFVPGREIFVLTVSDVKQIDKLIKSVIREAVKGAK
jgi:hypothetical protein